MIKVMHIDGDGEVRETVDMVLCLTGEFVVMPCETGAEAVAQLGAFGPEVFLIDTHHPGDDVKDTLAAIQSKSEFRDTPVIFMTPGEAPMEKADLEAVGVADVIRKPFDPMGLAARIKGALPDYAWSAADTQLFMKGRSMTSSTVGCSVSFLLDATKALISRITSVSSLWLLEEAMQRSRNKPIKCST